MQISNFRSKQDEQHEHEGEGDKAICEVGWGAQKQSCGSVGGLYLEWQTRASPKSTSRSGIEKKGSKQQINPRKINPNNIKREEKKERKKEKRH
jgi:hypothetical protein